MRRNERQTIPINTPPHVAPQRGSISTAFIRARSSNSISGLAEALDHVRDKMAAGLPALFSAQLAELRKEAVPAPADHSSGAEEQTDRKLDSVCASLSLHLA
jgi:hypothetical protein